MHTEYGKSSHIGYQNKGCSAWLTNHVLLLAVKQRMRSVTNIQKITKAMKMVAAKMRVAQVQTENSRGMVVPLIKSLGDLPGTNMSHEVCSA